MKRNKINLSQDQLIEHKKRIAFHEAGHAAAIYLNNKAKHLPPVFFQIIFKDLTSPSEHDVMAYQTTHDDCIARVDGGRLIEVLPSSIEHFVNKVTGHNDAMLQLVNDYMVAFDADIINLLIGPLAEAKHVANTDNELFNKQLVNLKALNNYGGSSDLALANDYLQSFSACKQHQQEKLNELFCAAFNFINDCVNWAAITKLANFILESNKNIISCEEVVLLLEQ